MIRSLLLCAATVGFATSAVQADEPVKLKAARGSLTLTVPAGWKQQPKKSRIIEHEFSVPGEGDSRDAAGRLTMMSAGGSVDANIERWVNQFPIKDGKPKVEELDVNHSKVHFVDIKGTYNDKPRPFGPGVMRDDYRMLAAIVPLGEGRNYFIKLYGPAATIEASAKPFRAMVKGVKTK